MASCSGLVKGAAYDCENPLVAGIRKRVLIGNINDIESVVQTGSVITAIVLKTGKKMFAFDGVRNSIQPRIELRAGTLSNTFAHLLGLSVFEVDSVSKDNLEAMAWAQMFAIVENINDSSNSDSIFEVYGLGGMEVSAMNRNPTDQDSGAAYVIEMGTPEGYGSEPKLAASFFDTDYATTLAKVDALLV